jgi:hypothetical protein
MADLASGDVTYTLLNRRNMGSSKKTNRVRLAFGDGALTVPANGIPISKGKLGCPTNIESMWVVDQGVSGYVFQYDQSAEKLVVMMGDNNNASDGPLVEASTVAIAAQTLEVEVIGY